ncbi:hypothetical protein [Methanoregula sp.]
MIVFEIESLESSGLTVHVCDADTGATTVDNAGAETGFGEIVA